MKYLNALNMIPGIGTQKLQLLVRHFSAPEEAWNSSYQGFREAGLSEKLAERIIREKSNIIPDKEWSRLEKYGVNMITLQDPDYPRLLKEIPNPPYIIYRRGEADISQAPMVSIVGSRKYTDYGKRIASCLSKDLAKSGLLVVSGMAIGIDTFSHQGALESGETIAVLGNGLDDESIYPRVNFNLSERIASCGALISEYPLGTNAGPLTFPARNRIIAGLGLGTLVVEAQEKSGALITAQMALDYNREVFSTPGSIFSPQSAGTNQLIKRGAKVVTGVKDILEELDIEDPASGRTEEKHPSSEEERMILEMLSHDPVHIDIISKATKLKTSVVSSILVMMEIKGWTRNIGGQNYILL